MSGSSSPRSVRTGALALVALCLASSGLLRSERLIAAFATEAATPVAPMRQQAACDRPDALMAALREEGAELEARARSLDERAAVIKIGEAEIDARLAELAEAEERLAATLQLADGAAERDLAQLTSIYENVKPKRAAGLFDAMAPSFAAGVLGRMSPPAAAAILTEMNAEKAYAVSVLMAARNVDATVPQMD